MSGTATFDPLVPPTPKPASGALQIAAATVGNALEWFDILVYSYFATTIAGVFFPNSNPVVSLLLTFGSFGLSYLARPLGAVVLGAYADRSGRKNALALSIRLMVIGTAVMDGPGWPRTAGPPPTTRPSAASWYLASAG